jgi:hypothetical protein
MDGAMMDTQHTSFEASPVGLSIAGLAKKRGQRFVWTTEKEPVPESSGTGGFDSPMDSVAIRAKSQADVVATIPISVALDWIGPAEGTPPQPVRIEIKTTSRRVTTSYYLSERASYLPP